MSQVTSPTEPNKRLTALTRSLVHRRPGPQVDSSLDPHPKPLTPDDEVAIGFDLLARFLLAATAASGVAVAVLDETGLYCRASAGEAPQLGTPIRMENTLSGRCIHTAATFYCEDTLANCPNALPARSILLLPIVLGRKPRGLIALFSRQPQAFAPASAAMARSAAELMAMALNAWSPQLDCPIDGQVLEIDVPQPVPSANSLAGSADPVRARITAGSAATGGDRVGKVLYGLPCSKCGAYFPAVEKRCPVCNTLQ